MGPADFQPPPLLRPAHVQSFVAGSTLRRRLVHQRSAALRAASVSQIIDCADGVRLLALLTPPKAATNRVAVLLHGWEGSADSLYLLSAAARLHDEGYRIVRINMRDHGDTHHLNREIFHSCRLDEVADAVGWVARQFPGEQVYLAGFSLGANFALRTAALPGGPPLARVAAICPVLDPVQTMYALDQGLAIYRYYFMLKWRRSLMKKSQAFPDLYDFTSLGHFRTLEKMTEHLVTRYTEYPDLMTYLRGYAITGDRLAGLRVPATILLAEDDPVIPACDSVRLAKSPLLEVQQSRFGGHCGFIGSHGLHSWLDDYLVRVFSN